MTSYRLLIGKLLYTGRLVTPVIAFRASNAATISNALRLHHLKALNAPFRAKKSHSCILTYLPFDKKPFALEAMCDASLQSRNEKTNVREVVTFFRRIGNVVYAIESMFRFSCRVACKDTANLLAAADANDKLKCLNHLLAENIGPELSYLILDSRSALQLCTTTKEPETVWNKFLLASICQELISASLKSTRWTARASHLASNFTKNNHPITKTLPTVPLSGSHNNPKASYAITFNVVTQLCDPADD